MSPDPRWTELREGVREAHDLPEDVRGQVWDRLQSSIAAGETGPRLEKAAATGAPTGTVAAWVVAAVAATVAVTLGVRSMTGGQVRAPAVEAVHDKAETPSQRLEPKRVPVGSTEPVKPDDPEPAAAASPPSPERPELPKVRSQRKAPPGAGAPAEDPLRAELRLLDAAERALDRRDGTAALAALGRHEREFPGGQMREDRAAFRIRALCLLGKDAQARGELRVFRRTHPGSQHLPGIDRDCERR